MRAIKLLSSALIIHSAGAQPGTLDPTFGVNGKAQVAIAGSYCDAQAIAEQADGKLVLAGATPGFTMLARLLPDGAVDTGFGTNGVVLTDLDESNDFLNCVAVEPSGRIVAGGVRFNNASDGVAVVMRHLSNGAPDNSFGTNGVVSLVITGSSDSYVRGLALQPDGKTVLLGERWNGTNWSVFVARINANGALDGAFGVNYINIQGTGNEYGGDIRLQPDGKVVVCGWAESTSGGGLFAARLNANGTFDSGFGTGGKAFYDLGGQDEDVARSLRVQPDGKIVLGGLTYTSSGYGALVVRLQPNGALDTGFGTGGYTFIAIDVDSWASPALDLQPDGKIVLGVDNTGNFNPRVKVARLLPDGTLDSAFGTNGIGTSTATTGNNDEAAARTLFLSDGGIAVCGFADTPNNIQMAVWKFRSGVNVGVAEEEGIQELIVVPNPVEHSFTLTGKGLDVAASITVRHMTGREAMLPVTRMGHNLVADASGLNAGLYAISVRTSGGDMRTARFIKQ